MFEQLFKRSHYVNRHMNAPFLQERIQYIQNVAERGRAEQTQRDTAQYLLRVIEFLNLESRQTVSLEEIDQAAENWAKHQSKHPQKRRPFSVSAKEHFTYHAIHWLQMTNRLSKLPEESSALITKIFKRGAALKRHANAPLLKERLTYLQYWAENGAVESSLKKIAYYLLIVMKYLNFYEIREVTRDEIEEAAKRWAKNSAVNKRKTDYSKFAKARFIRDASGWFEKIGCLEKSVKSSIPFEESLSAYVMYMRVEQGLSEKTIDSRIFQVQDFLIKINDKINCLAEITPLLVDEVLTIKYEINHYSRRTIQSYASVIRSFLRYAENKGWCQKNLADCIKAPRVYRYELLPSSPGWDDVKKVLASSEGNNPTNIRDRAILMLLSIYGMRCSEVIHLRLEDLDWQNELLYLRRAKESKPQTFPLSKSVGNAILNYITQVRPNSCKLREVFLCMRAPYRRLDSSGVYQIVNRRLKPLHLNIKHHGPHALRHACATHLINEGVSLKEISDYLGHQSLETTRIYTKVDLVNLRKVADFELGGIL